jgi:glucan endo-1,3-alpha-glucosidase
VSITSGSTALGSQKLVPGYNQFSMSGLTVGDVSVTVIDTSSNSNVVSRTGPLPVVATSDICNYNFQVVALA